MPLSSSHRNERRPAKETVSRFYITYMDHTQKGKRKVGTINQKGPNESRKRVAQWTPNIKKKRIAKHRRETLTTLES